MASILESSTYIPVLLKGGAKECSNYRTIALVSHTSKVMLKVIQQALLLYMEQEMLDVQDGVRKIRGI